MNHYRTVPSYRVEYERRVNALAMLFVCRDHLKVALEYEWIEPCTEAEATLTRPNAIAGLYTAKTNTVYLRGDLEPLRMLHIAAHEVRHAWQIQKWGRPRRIDSYVVEADAERYAAAAVQKFLGQPTPEWGHLAKPESFPLQKAFDSDPEQTEDYLLTLLKHLNLAFK